MDPRIRQGSPKKVEDLAELVSIEHIDWIDPPHEGYRNYEHGHASWLLALRKRG